MSYNQANVRKPSHVIALSSDKIMRGILPGLGMTCEDPFDPVSTPLSPFLEDEQAQQFQADVRPVETDDVLTASTSFIETNDYRSMANTLRAHMRGSYSFVSASASFSQTKEKIEQRKVIVALISSAKTGPNLPESSFVWAGRELESLEEIEKIASEAERQDQFIQLFGSHYVSEVEVGYKLAISGEYESKDETERMAFAAAFKASFTGGGLGGGVSQEQQNMLRSTKTTIRSELTCGNISPDLPLLTTTYDEVLTRLKALADGTIRLTRGPVRAVVRSYFASLIGYPQTRKVLGQEYEGDLPSPFGVPRGTVISWYPPQEAITLDGEGQRVVAIPQGWALADGTANPLDLRDRFILGTGDLMAVGKTGGEWSHNHSGRANIADRGAWRGAGSGNQQFVPADFRHSLEIDSANHAPPYVALVYLVKV